MTLAQSVLVEENLHLVKVVIKRHIRINPENPELCFDELYQIGSLALCSAAMSYDLSLIHI